MYKANDNECANEHLTDISSALRLRRQTLLLRNHLKHNADTRAHTTIITAILYHLIAANNALSCQLHTSTV